VENENIDDNLSKAASGSPELESISITAPVIEPIKRVQRTLPFAVVTLLSLIFSLGSLTIISERQSALAESEADMRTLQERITASIFLTLDSDNPMDSIDKQEVIDPRKIRTSYLNLSEAILKAKQEISGGNMEEPRGYPSELFYLIDRFSLSSRSSNSLLGILLISCGILGSVMSTMRDGRGEASKTVVLGASVGFVALLSVKGGSALFIMTSAGIDVPFNPYSTAFAGVVAGMFSEKLYIALSKLTDKAFGDETNANNQSQQTR